MTSLIRLENLGKDYNGFTAVGSISTEVQKGEVYGFIGPNGAGKTTTIKCLVGAIYPTRGKVYLDGYDVFASPIDSQVNLGYIPETTTSLYFDMSAIKFVSYAGELKGLSKQTSRNNAEQLLDILGLGEFKTRKIGKMSTGMKQRVNIAQALVNDPKIVIADEPTVGLDPVGKRDLLQLILKLKTLGKTIFISSHILDEVEKIIDQVAIINKGEITFNGSFNELQDTYKPDTFYISTNNHKQLQSILEQNGIKIISSSRFGITIQVPNDYKFKGIFNEIYESGSEIREFRSVDSSLNRLFFDTVASGDSQDSFILDDLSIFKEEA
ncbi:MAG: ATP-binding cassette domain-containing protein [Candidatus Kariarchaeaceae archaeon]|jgi:ABC-2 type transport system ATP-binding protein